MVYLRLSTHKESPQSFITATIFGKIVYDNFLMDMPRLLDLCTLFYNDNQALVEKMIKNVITQAEGRYDNDIMQASRTMREALLKVQQKVDILVFQTPGMISSAKNSQVHQELVDLSFYSADILQTISLFLQAYKPAAKIFHRSHLQGKSLKEVGASTLLGKKQSAAESSLFGSSHHRTAKSDLMSSNGNEFRPSDDMMQLEFENFLATFYEHSLIPVYRHILKQKQLQHISEEDASMALSRIQLARQSAISAFRGLININCLSPLLDGLSNEEYENPKFSGANLVAELGEDYMHVVTTSLSEHHFLYDYNQKHSIRDDLELMQQVGVELDPMRVQYLYDGINALQSVIVAGSKGYISSSKDISHESTPSDFEKPSTSSGKSSSNSKQQCDQNQLDSLVSQVRDLLPNLGEGFVLACLDYFDNSAEDVINTLLEENLPPHLESMDRNLPKQKNTSTACDNLSQESHQILQDKENLSSRRLNVYDGDEFDINARDSIDISKIHKGKQRRAKNANLLLDDKRELKTADMRDKFAALSIIVDEEYLAKGEIGNDYDDEYDDTYDDQAMGEREPDANEFDNRRPFVLPQALGGGHVTYVKEEESDEEIQEEPKNKPFDFTRNPEEVRREAERKRQEQVHRNRKDKGKGGSIPNRDVIGRAKGQGQEKNVVINRKHKTENKGKRTRAAADRKMAKGMF